VRYCLKQGYNILNNRPGDSGAVVVAGENRGALGRALGHEEACRRVVRRPACRHGVVRLVLGAYNHFLILILHQYE